VEEEERGNESGGVKEGERGEEARTTFILTSKTAGS
jgi:hypothetical protein